MGDVAIQVQSVIDGIDAATMVRSLRSVANAVNVWHRRGGRGVVRVLHTDLHSTPLFGPSDVSQFNQRFGNCLEYEYRHGDAVAGKADAHNALAQGADADYLLFLDASAVVGPTLIEDLMRPFSGFGGTCGAAEARPIPVDPRKPYQEKTGETSWCSWGCMMVRHDAFIAVGGFESTLGSGPADVDLSWRMRLAGYSLAYVPEVSFFCPVDSRSDGIALFRSSYVEALGLLLMAHRWNYEMLGQKALRNFELSDNETLRRAATDFKELRRADRLPEQLDPDHAVAVIDGEGHYV